ncbi:MAG: hypothetical protein QOD95_2980, partial [Gammaproteobacteria bacterium]|nr:hypothetical protein [Gammaproteobacteria bacterium]
PNTGEPLGKNRLMKTAENTVYYDSGHPSAVKLHVMRAVP